MTLTEVRVVGGPLSGAVLGLSEPLPERLSGEELQDLVALPALRAALAGGSYVWWPVSSDPQFVWRDAEQTGAQ